MFMSRMEAKDFNSHTREGVTPDEGDHGLTVDDFNSHTREGVTLRKISLASLQRFQLTHP